MKRLTGFRPAGRRSLVVIGVIVLTLAVALLGGTTSAGAKKKKPKATLSISVPSSVANHSSWSIQASGKAGLYNKVGFHAYYGTTSCAETEQGMELGGSGGDQVAVARRHSFSVSGAFVAANPGTHTACVYLYKASAPGGPQLRRTATYTVTP